MNLILTNLRNRGRILGRTSAFSSAFCTLRIRRHFEFHPSETWRHTGSCDWTNVYLRNTPSLLIWLYVISTVALRCNIILRETINLRKLSRNGEKVEELHTLFRAWIFIARKGNSQVKTRTAHLLAQDISLFLLYFIYLFIHSFFLPFSFFLSFFFYFFLYLYIRIIIYYRST